MVDDPRNRLQPDGPFADAGVAILAAGEGHQAVVQVDGVQLAQPDMPVELLQHPVKIVDDIISSRIDVAGVEAHAHLVAQRYRAEDMPQLLETASDLGPLAGHGFQQDAGGLFRTQDRVQQFDDEPHAHIDPLPHMAAGMKIIQHMRQIRVQRHHVLAHGVPRKRPQPLIEGTRVQRIRRVPQNGREGVLLHQAAQGFRVLGVRLLGLAAPRVARKKLERIRLDGERFFPHVAVPFGTGQVTPDMQHDDPS